MKAILELRELEINHINLVPVIIFIAFPSNKVNQVVEKLIRRAEETASVIYIFITWKKIINQFMHIYQYNVKLYQTILNISHQF
ncbi:hypothetical protein C2G38_2096361 [Gigaspora rosea]|uniref:Uncharacterized protein n=1 Tax=Gigaspora rosea TaxID=44941 RepID=A0A397UVF7_9GLOM|nr:hypothetical protein C2G38_2096361 [Gigaspora rosea]